MNDDFNYYEILGISKNSTTNEIKKAYRNLAKKWHPDVNKNENSSTIMNQLNKAKEVLLDDDKRKEYDEYLDKKISEAYQKFDKTTDKNTEYKNREKTYTKKEYFKDYLKYYNASKIRKFFAILFVSLETIICFVLQLINYILVYFIFYFKYLLFYGGLLLLILLSVSFVSKAVQLSLYLKIIYFISAFILIISPTVIFKFLSTKMPNYLERLNIFLFKKAVGYKN